MIPLHLTVKVTMVRSCNITKLVNGKKEGSSHLTYLLPTIEINVVGDVVIAQKFGNYEIRPLE